MNHDGQGAGVKNFDIGGVQFDVAAVSQVKSCSPEVMADETNHRASPVPAAPTPATTATTR
ncbi:maltoporin [Klebsiella pneumoniae]|uniref:Maltoporin n=1 Tax=Klebsiella pneumoniae TaxID=573 RepID=A0A377ZQV7_KLEPN|nr:maltoporin [Klebsiella pneumoniae]